MRGIVLAMVGLVLSACGQGADKQEPSAAPTTDYSDRCEARDATANGTQKMTFFAVSGSKEDPFRAVALITLNDGFVCSGVLIADDTLLTSAHCFEGKRQADGIQFKDSTAVEGEKIKVASVTLNPAYAAALNLGESLETSPGLASVDSAYVKLAAPVSDRRPVRMATKTKLAAGSLVSIIGYGDLGSGAGTKRFAYSHVGRYVDDAVIGKEHFRNLLLLDSKSGAGACPGDSGGGVFAKDGDTYALLGIVNGVNDLLYPGFPVTACDHCPNGIGIVTLGPFL